MSAVQELKDQVESVTGVTHPPIKPIMQQGSKPKTFVQRTHMHWVTRAMRKSNAREAAAAKAAFQKRSK